MARSFTGASGHEINIDGVQGDLKNDSAVTVAAWINLNSYGGAGEAYIRQICGDDAGSTDGTLGIRVGTDGTDANKNKLYGQAQTDLYGRDGLSGTTAISLNTWYHVAFVWDVSGNKVLYIDGSQEASATSAASDAITGSPTGTLFIGDDNTRGRNWDGEIAEVSFWNAALSAGEIAGLAARWTPHQVRPQNCYAYFPLEGLESPEPSRRGFVSIHSGTLVGPPTKADHPPIIYPSGPMMGVEIAAAPGGSAPLYKNHLHKLMSA